MAPSTVLSHNLRQHQMSSKFTQLQVSGSGDVADLLQHQPPYDVVN